MNLLRMPLRCVWALALATIADGQAAIEYAARSGASALSGNGSSLHLGVCQLDSTVVPCVRQYYPAAFYVAIAALCVFLGAVTYPKQRH